MMIILLLFLLPLCSAETPVEPRQTTPSTRRLIHTVITKTPSTPGPQPLTSTLPSTLVPTRSLLLTTLVPKVSKPLSPLFDVAGHFVIKSHHDTYLRCPEDYDHKVHAVKGPTKLADRWTILHKGDKVTLQRSDLEGHFLSADRHGHVSLTNSSGKSELWSAIRYDDDWTWSFKSAHGQWLSALEDGFVRTHPKQGPWERFSLEASKLHRWSAQVAGKFALKSAHNTYLRAHGPEYNSDKVDTVEWKRSWEHWTIIDLEGKVVLKAPVIGNLTDRFLSADKYGHASLERIAGDSEIWIPFQNKDGSFSFLNLQNEQWLSALDDGFVRTIKHRKEFEKFTLEPWNLTLTLN